MDQNKHKQRHGGAAGTKSFDDSMLSGPESFESQMAKLAQNPNDRLQSPSHLFSQVFGPAIFPPKSQGMKSKKTRSVSENFSTSVSSFGKEKPSNLWNVLESCEEEYPVGQFSPSSSSFHVVPPSDMASVHSQISAHSGGPPGIPSPIGQNLPHNSVEAINKRKQLNRPSSFSFSGQNSALKQSSFGSDMNEGKAWKSPFDDFPSFEDSPSLRTCSFHVDHSQARSVENRQNAKRTNSWAGPPLAGPPQWPTTTSGQGLFGNGLDGELSESGSFGGAWLNERAAGSTQQPDRSPFSNFPFEPPVGSHSGSPSPVNKDMVDPIAPSRTPHHFGANRAMSISGHRSEAYQLRHSAHSLSVSDPNAFNIPKMTTPGVFPSFPSSGGNTPNSETSAPGQFPLPSPRMEVRHIGSAAGEIMPSNRAHAIDKALQELYVDSQSQRVLPSGPGSVSSLDSRNVQSHQMHHIPQQGHPMHRMQQQQQHSTQVPQRMQQQPVPQHQLHQHMQQRSANMMVNNNNIKQRQGVLQSPSMLTRRIDGNTVLRRDANHQRMHLQQQQQQQHQQNLMVTRVNGRPLAPSNHPSAAAVAATKEAINNTMNQFQEELNKKMHNEAESSLQHCKYGRSNDELITMIRHKMNIPKIMNSYLVPVGGKNVGFQPDNPQIKAVMREFIKGFKEMEQKPIGTIMEYFCHAIATRPFNVHSRMLMELAEYSKRVSCFFLSELCYCLVNIIDPLLPQGWFEHSKAQEESGSLADSRELLYQGIANCYCHPALLLRTIQLEERVGNVSGVRGLFAQSRRVAIQASWKVLLEAAMFESQSCNHDAATTMFQFLVKAVPWYGPIRLETALAYERAGDDTKAISILQSSVAEITRYGLIWGGLQRLFERLEHKQMSEQMETWLGSLEDALSGSTINVEVLKTNLCIGIQGDPLPSCLKNEVFEKCLDSYMQSVNYNSRELVWKSFFAKQQTLQRVAQYIRVYWHRLRALKKKCEKLAQVQQNPVLFLHSCVTRLGKHADRVLKKIMHLMLSSHQYFPQLGPRHSQNLFWKLWNSCSDALLVTNQVSLASKVTQHALDLAPLRGKSRVLRDSCHVLEFQGRYDDCEKVLNFLMEKDSDARVCLSMVSLLTHRNQLQRALDCALSGIEQHAGCGRLWGMAVQLMMTLRKPHEALHLAARALKVVPKSGEVWCDSARIFLNPSFIEEMPIDSKQRRSLFNPFEAMKHLTFASKFTPQYGDTFVEMIKAEIIIEGPLKGLLKILCEETGLNGLWNAEDVGAATEGKLNCRVKEVANVLPGHLLSLASFYEESSLPDYEWIPIFTQKANDYFKLSTPLTEKDIPHLITFSRTIYQQIVLFLLKTPDEYSDELADVELMEILKRCHRAEPNYGSIWYHCKTHTHESLGMVFDRATEVIKQEMCTTMGIYLAGLLASFTNMEISTLIDIRDSSLANPDCMVYWNVENLFSNSDCEEIKANFKSVHTEVVPSSFLTFSSALMNYNHLLLDVGNILCSPYSAHKDETLTPDISPQEVQEMYESNSVYWETQELQELWKSVQKIVFSCHLCFSP